MSLDALSSWSLARPNAISAKSPANASMPTGLPSAPVHVKDAMVVGLLVATAPRVSSTYSCYACRLHAGALLAEAPCARHEPPEAIRMQRRRRAWSGKRAQWGAVQAEQDTGRVGSASRDMHRMSRRIQRAGRRGNGARGCLSQARQAEAGRVLRAAAFC
jgi:hypothetical protein